MSIVDPCPTSRKNSKKRKAEDENLQYPFIDGVACFCYKDLSVWLFSIR